LVNNPHFEKDVKYSDRKEVVLEDNFYPDCKIYNNTLKYRKKVIFEGFLHAFLTEGDGGELFSVAVIEKLNGQVVTVEANHVRFMDR